MEILLLMKIRLLFLFLWSFFGLFAQNALQFDGVNDIVTVNYPGILGNNARTVEAWIKTTANYDPNTGGVQGVISDWGTFTNSNRSTFNILFNNAIRFEVNGNGVNGTIPVNDGNWHHVAMVYDPTATLKVSLYVDGVLDIAGNLTIPVNTLSSYVRLGQRVDGIHFLNGKMDEFRLWSVALTQAQIIANKDKELCHLNDPNLKLYYTFNQGLANGANAGLTTVHDWSPNQKDGTLVNFTLTGATSNWVSGAPLSAGFSVATSTETSCGVYTSALNGQQYAASGTYSINGLTQAGCDSLLTLNLTVLPSYLSVENNTSCASYHWAQTGQTYTTSGIYYDSLTAINGCDSIFKLNLTILPVSNQISHVYSCGAYAWNQTGMMYNDSGTYSDTLMSTQGCDSIITILLTVYPIEVVSVNVTACQSYFWTEANQMLTASGTYSALFQSVFGCDSMVSLTLQLNFPDTTYQNLTACQGTYWSEAGIWMNTTGVYAHIFQNLAGCDSIVYVDFVLQSFNANLSIDATTGNATASPAAWSYVFISCENGAILQNSINPSITLTSNGLYAVVVTINGCIDTSDCVSFLSAGMNEFQNNFIHLSPNPCEDAFHVNGLEQDGTPFLIKDVSGKVMLEGQFASAKNAVVQVDTFVSGAYFLVLPEQNTCLRLIKQ